MVHAQGGDFEAAAGDSLTRRTLPLFFDVLRMLLAERVSVVAEAAFQDRLWRQGLEPLAQLARLRIVQCHTSPAVGRERRRRDESAHARLLGDEIEYWERAYASFDRISMSAPSLDVDTTDGLVPDLEAIVEFVNRHQALS